MERIDALIGCAHPSSGDGSQLPRRKLRDPSQVREERQVSQVRRRSLLAGSFRAPEGQPEAFAEGFLVVRRARGDVPVLDQRPRRARAPIFCPPEAWARPWQSLLGWEGER